MAVLSVAPFSFPTSTSSSSFPRINAEEAAAQTLGVLMATREKSVGEGAPATKRPKREEEEEDAEVHKNAPTASTFSSSSPRGSPPATAHEPTVSTARVTLSHSSSAVPAAPSGGVKVEAATEGVGAAASVVSAALANAVALERAQAEPPTSTDSLAAARLLFRQQQQQQHHHHQQQQHALLQQAQREDRQSQQQQQEEQQKQLAAQVRYQQMALASATGCMPGIGMTPFSQAGLTGLPLDSSPAAKHYQQQVAAAAAAYSQQQASQPFMQYMGLMPPQAMAPPMSMGGWNPHLQMQLAAWQQQLASMGPMPATGTPSTAATAFPQYSQLMQSPFLMPVLGSVPPDRYKTGAEAGVPAAPPTATTSEEDSFRLSIEEAKRFVAHVSRSRATVEVVMPRQLCILQNLAADHDKLATLRLLLPHEADLPLSKPGAVSRCRQCGQVRQLHGRAPLCMPCVKHNGANMRLFRDSFPGVSPADNLELFVYVTLRRHFAHSRHRCNCEGGPQLQCKCLRTSDEKCVPCRFLRGLIFVIAYNMWCKHV